MRRRRPAGAARSRILNGQECQFRPLRQHQPHASTGPCSGLCVHDQVVEHAVHQHRVTGDDGLTFDDQFDLPRAADVEARTGRSYRFRQVHPDRLRCTEGLNDHGRETQQLTAQQVDAVTADLAEPRLLREKPRESARRGERLPEVVAQQSHVVGHLSRARSQARITSVRDPTLQTALQLGGVMEPHVGSRIGPPRCCRDDVSGRSRSRIRRSHPRNRPRLPPMWRGTLGTAIPHGILVDRLRAHALKTRKWPA